MDPADNDNGPGSLRSSTASARRKEVDRHVGSRIRARRLSLALSDRNVASALRISRRRLEEFESGRRRVDPHQLTALAELLEVPLVHFFREFVPGASEANAPAVDWDDEEAMRIRSLILAAGLAVTAHNAAAGQTELTIARFRGIPCLPLAVMEDRKLVEQHARALGLGEISVRYPVMTSGGLTLDAVISGRAQFAATGIAPFLFAWDRTRDNIGVKAIGPLSSTPLYLVTRDDYVHSVADFRESDRITVGNPKSTMQAVLLQMAAAKAFGRTGYAKLDHLTIGMPNPEAAVALISGSSGVSADFNVPPFSYKEIDARGVHLVTDSNELLGGPASFAMLMTTTRFQSANPKLVAAVTAALDEAIGFIQKDRQVAGEIYRRVSEEQYTDILQRLIDDPRITFDREPHGMMKYATFMHSTGALKHDPTSWRDFFLPAAAELRSGD